MKILAGAGVTGVRRDLPTEPAKVRLLKRVNKYSMMLLTTEDVFSSLNKDK